MDNKLIKVLTKNAIKCLMCNTILESKHRHDFVMCPCPNQTFADGGLSYNKVGGKDLSLIENLCEYRTLTQEAYDKEQEDIKTKQLAKNEQGVKDGLLVKIGNDYYNKKTISLLVDLRLHEVQAEEIKSEILETLVKIDRLYGLN